MRIAQPAAVLIAGVLGLQVAFAAPTVVDRFSNDHEINAVHFGAEGSTFVAVSSWYLRFWNVGLGEILTEKIDARDGQFRLSRSIEGNRFVLMGADGVRLYDMEQGDLVASLGEGYVKAMDYDPVSKRVAALLQRIERAGGTRMYYALKLVVYDVEDEVDRGWFDRAWHAVFGRSAPGPILEVELPVSQTTVEEWRFSLVALRKAGEEVVVVGRPEAIVWSVDEEEEIRRFKTDVSSNAYTISPGGSYYINCNSRVFDIDLWSIDEGKQVASMEQPGYPQACRFSEDATEVVIETASREGRFETSWSVRDGTELGSTEVDPEFARDSTAWSGDGSMFVAVSEGGYLRRYGADDDEPAATGRLPKDYLDADDLRYDRRGFRGPACAVYVNDSGSHAVWAIGRQGVIWSLQ